MFKISSRIFAVSAAFSSLLIFATFQKSSIAEEKAPSPIAQRLGVEQILERYAQALGGYDAARRMTTLKMIGTFEMPDSGLKGTFEFYQKAPNKQRSVFVTADKSLTVSRGFDGTRGWELKKEGPAGGPVVSDIRGAELIQMKRTADIHREYKLGEIYPQMKLRGPGKVDQKDVLIVEATPADGRMETMYFDAQTNLLVRRDSYVVTAQGSALYEDYLENYRAVSGLMFPFTLSSLPSDNSPGGLIIRFQDAQINQPLSDSFFAVPRG